jgi:hypothetical protein
MQIDNGEPVQGIPRITCNRELCNDIIPKEVHAEKDCDKEKVYDL